MIHVDGFKILGGKKLKGDIKVSGSKNASLPILAATLLADGEYIIENVPNLKDVKTMLELLKELGLLVEKLDKNSYKIINVGKDLSEASYELVKTMRASFLVMGPLLGKIKRARVSLPGGCAIGARPVNYHLKGFERLGAKITIKHGYVEGTVDDLKGDSIYLDFPSVGATENILMAAVKAEGKTIIENAAQEPEIDDLCNVLIKMGAKIDGVGSNRLEIEGVNSLKSFNHKVIPDRIEAGTYLIASLLFDGNIRVQNMELNHLESFVIKLKEMGAKFEGDNENGYKVKGDIKDLKPIKITTMPYPGFPTDLQPQMLVLISLLNGKICEVKETIFENRFMHVSELNRMGADIETDGNLAVITGVKKFSSAKVMASDLRAGAGLVLAALCADGETQINRVYHIDRGYEKIEEKLQGLGADIKREKVVLG